MQRISRYSLAFIIGCSILFVSCASQTPAEKVAATRAEYKATLNSFFVKETPLEINTLDFEEGLEGEEPAEAEAEGTEGDDPTGEEMEAATEVRLDAVLDVIVQHDTSSPLAGLTLDVTMVDAKKNELERWRYWVDTEGMPKANQRPYSVVFEDVAYEEGYGFHVEVRHPIPETERGQYREFEGL